MRKSGRLNGQRQESLHSPCCAVTSQFHDARFLCYLAAVATGACLALGCGDRPAQTAPSVSTVRSSEESLPTLIETVRKGADLETCRSALQQINSYLDRHREEQPRSLTDEERNLLTREFGLEESELAEVAGKNFSVLDSHHLELCLLLREAVRSLKVDNLPPVEQAAAAFGWVVREVGFREHGGDLLPPQFIVRIGLGNGHERALVFLAMLDQLGIDGCMIAIPAGPQTEQIRYWIPGALMGKDIYLFDTRLGLPLPGPKGQGIATLSQVRAQPEILKNLVVDPRYPYDVTPEQAKKAEAHVACPLLALSPRMESLEGWLSAGDRIRLWANPVAAFQRYRTALSSPPRVWNLPGDPNTPIRVLRQFLPQEDGGTGKGDRRQQIIQQQVPWQYLPTPFAQLPGQPGQRLRQMFAAPFIHFNTQPHMQRELMMMWLPGLMEAGAENQGARKAPELLQRGRMPRDLMLRGRFDEATTLLVAILGEMHRQRDALQETLRTQPTFETVVGQWCDLAIRLHAELARAQEEAARPKGKSSLAAATKLAEATERVNQFWRANETKIIALLLQGAAAVPMSGQTTHLLALCKHEQAERAQLRLDQTKRSGKKPSATETKAVQEAWTAAASWWSTYLEEQGGAPQAPGARRLRGRALEALGQREAATALLENLNGEMSNLEKTAFLYEAKRLKSR